ncbi:MAG: aminotransferase class I/II-fold pyridoxal phosphate-dependent enzyme [Proteobacteria bacterium]|nr:aminotransferase class I/II-fold pyridoxal phosphate-dependent enzyme [Pseudomonadota bacterium]
MPNTNRVFLSPPCLSGEEQKLVGEAFASNYIAPLGPMVDRFEKDLEDLTGYKHVVALSSGTAALHLALRCLGIGPGDEVWAATLTFIASLAGANYQGATTVFIDADPATWCLDPQLLEEALREAASRGRLPKAVIPTDLFGQSCDLDAIVGICDRHGIPVVCDSAEAVGARYKDRHAGKGARAAALSFNGNKIVTTSSGGALASDDAALISLARKLSTQAREPVPHYEHVAIGYNYRLSNILAAVGCAQLGDLEERVRHRRWVFGQYMEYLANLPGIQFMPEAPYGTSNRWLSVIVVDAGQFGASREDIRLLLERHNIESRPIWKPMHLQPVFAGSRCIGGGAVSERLFATGLCLPSGHALTDRDIQRICDLIRSLCRTVN